MATLQELKARLSQLGLARDYGYRRELRLLPQILEPDEELRAVTSGVHDGLRRLVVLTQRRLLVLQKPAVGKPSLLYVPREEITAAEGRRGVLFGVLTIHTSAQPFVFYNVAKKSLPPFLEEISPP
ncbi:MAG: PH domain-containing protein [Spirochaetia bacterium]